MALMREIPTVAAALVLTVLVLSAVWFAYQVEQAFATPGEHLDFQVVSSAAARIRAGLDPYDIAAMQRTPFDELYKYPPFVGSVMRLGLIAGWPGFANLWMAASLVFYAVTFIMILGIEGLKLVSIKSGVLAIAFFGWLPSIQTIQEGQQEYLILLLFTMACWAATSSPVRHAIAGSCIALCAIIKIYPAFFLLDFLLRRRWMSVAAFAAAFAALTVISIRLSWFGLQREFWFGVLPTLSGATAYPNNQSLLAFFMRLFVNGATADWARAAVMPLAAALYHAACAAVVAVSAAALFRSADPRDGFKILLPAMVMMTPDSWIYYEQVLLLPFGLLLGPCSRQTSLAFWLPFGLATLLVALGDEDDVLNTASGLLQSYKFYGILLFWLLGLVTVTKQSPPRMQAS